jgi:hypothetical protein
MKTKKWMAPLAVACALGVTGLANAQPNVGGGQAQNPQNQQPGGGRPDFRNMTPEERQQMMQQFRERGIRRALEGGGFTAATIQDPVVAYAKAQDAAITPLQDLARQLVEAVSTPGVTDDKIAALLKQFQEAVAAEKARRKTARAELDKKINFSKQARLEALLTSLGLVGEDSLGLGALGGFGGRGGFGGPGGGPGGAGGPGGRGGQNNQGGNAA